MKAPLYTTQGKSAGEIELNDAVFSYPWNSDLVHQVLIAQQANRRPTVAHAKDRSEVRGGGKKPWRQKGTGRARHGSNRSPIWAGGGVTHGPTKDKNYAQKINRKMVRNALHAVISKRLANGDLKIIDSLNINSGKTKDLMNVVKNFSEGSLSALVVVGAEGAATARASRNIPKVKSTAPTAMNVEDLLKYKTILLDKEAISHIS